MDFLKNLPFFSIMISMFGGIICSMLKGRKARYLSYFTVGMVCAMSFILLLYVINLGDSFTYMMGHFPAPWGNEIRAGAVEALTAFVFSTVMLLSIIGGARYTDDYIEKGKQNYFYLLVNLLMGALLALIYTNDIFTGYVFLEINTIATCGLIMIKHTGKAVASAIQYMIMSLLGSGLVLIGITLLYTLTGHLLMPNIKTSIALIVEDGSYTIPLLMVIGLITVGLSIKSGLYPFHLWIPDAYSNSIPSSSAILSSLASKGYVIFLIKIYYRVIGIDSIISSKVLNVVFVFGVVAIIMGSIHATHEGDIRRMSAFSSVSHVGYIFMCIGMGTELGMAAALFHIFMHSVSKALIFLSCAGIADVSGIRLSGFNIQLRDANGLLNQLINDNREKHRGRMKKLKSSRESRKQIAEQQDNAQVTEIFNDNVRDIAKNADIILRKPSVDSNRFDDIKGAAFRNKTAGFGYSIGALSMVGIPLLAGFASKMMISQASLETGAQMPIVMISMAISTILMVIYFLRMLIQIYARVDGKDEPLKKFGQQKGYGTAIIIFVVLNFVLGIFSGQILEIIVSGFESFG